MQRARIEPGQELDAIATKPVATDHHMDFRCGDRQAPRGARQVFVLHDVEGYRHEEIARMMRVTTGTSKAQLHRARLLLRATLRA